MDDTGSAAGAGHEILTLTAAPFSADAFAPYGEVIESAGEAESMNQGMGRRFRDLARVDVLADDGRPAISRVRCLPEPVPVRLRLMERHPLSTQAFIPADGQRYIVVVAPAGEPPGLEALRAFLCRGAQGVSYGRGVWHHPMIALDNQCDFIEVHRAGPGANCDEVELAGAVEVRLPD